MFYSLCECMYKKVDEWITLCCTVVVEHVLMNELYLNSMINHCVRKTIMSRDVVSYL